MLLDFEKSFPLPFWRPTEVCELTSSRKLLSLLIQLRQRRWERERSSLAKCWLPRNSDERSRMRDPRDGHLKNTVMSHLHENRFSFIKDKQRHFFIFQKDYGICCGFLCKQTILGDILSFLSSFANFSFRRVFQEICFENTYLPRLKGWLLKMRVWTHRVPLCFKFYCPLRDSDAVVRTTDNYNASSSSLRFCS